MTNPKLNQCPYDEGKLSQLFENEFDCYTGFDDEQKCVEDQMAMTKKQFIKVVMPLLNALPVSSVDEKLLELSDSLIENIKCQEAVCVNSPPFALNISNISKEIKHILSNPTQSTLESEARDKAIQKALSEITALDNYLHKSEKLRFGPVEISVNKIKSILQNGRE